MRRTFALATAVAALAAGAAHAVDVPRIEALRTIRIHGARTRLRVVSDGSDSVVLSAEAHGTLLVGRFDPRTGDGRVAWTAAVVPEELPDPVADHAHVFAHGVHWILFSTRSANWSFLLRLDRNLHRLSLAPVTRGGLPADEPFLVATGEGVAAGHHLPGVGHRIFRFDSTGAPRGTVDLGGGRYRHANGASADAIPEGFRILAPETLDPRRASALLEITADAGWRPISLRRLVSERASHLAMATSAPVPGGGRILLARVRSLEPADSSVLADDGAIVRYRIDPRGRVASRVTLVAAGGDRPNQIRIGDLLLSAYEFLDACWMRVERI